MGTSSRNPRLGYIGVDSGKSGGIALLTSSRSLAVPMPATDSDILSWIAENVNGLDCAGVLEKVGGFIGGTGHPGSAMFKFGCSYGSIRMALVASRIPFEEITPQKWQKALGISARKKTETKTQWKNRLKQIAQQLFPNVSVTLKTCDALLIAEYCRRKHEWRI